MSFLVSSRTLQHRSGSKEYHLLAIENKANGKAIIVLRWGKTNAWGQLQVHQGQRADIELLWEGKTREKEKGGYEQTKNKSTEVSIPSDVPKLIGPQYYKNIGADNLKFLDAGFDTSGVKDPVQTKFVKNDDGSFSADNTPRKSPPVKPVEETFEERQARDPLWGMFG